MQSLVDALHNSKNDRFGGDMPKRYQQQLRLRLRAKIELEIYSALYDRLRAGISRTLHRSLGQLKERDPAWLKSL